MKIIRPTSISNSMLVSSSVAEPDTTTSETAWSATEIGASGDERYVGSPSSTVTITNANPAVVTWTAHPVVAGTPIVLSTSGTLPAGLTAGTTYFVRSVLTANTFTVSATASGRSIKTTSAGSGTHTATAKVHKIYTAALGQRSAVTVDTGADTVAYTAHGLAADTPVVFTNSGGGLPSPLVAGTTYYVKAPTTDTFQVAATAGGSAINLTTAGTGTHTCGLASNYNKPPLQNEAVWVYTAPTNRWAMFDQQIGSSTMNADSLEVVLSPGRFNALALLQVDASTVDVRLEINRTTVTITIASPGVVSYTAHGLAADTPVVLTTTGALPTGLTAGTTYYVRSPAADTFQLSATAGGASINTSGSQSGVHTLGELIYSASMNMVSDVNVGNWYQYFYEPIYQTDTVVLTDLVDATLIDLPTYGEGVLTVTFTRSGGVVSCGALIVGMYSQLGTTLDKPEISITDYSLKTTDDFGNVTVTERAFSKRVKAQVWLDADQTDNVAQIITAYRSKPLVWIGADEVYTSLIVYGFVVDWGLVPQELSAAILNLEIEGLT